jgi:hypothetical protein
MKEPAASINRSISSLVLGIASVCRLFSQPNSCPLTGTETVHFDSAVVPSGQQCTDATSFLISKGITFTALTQGLLR